METYQSIEFRKNIKEVVRPLEKDGIDNIDFYHEKNEKTSVTKQDYKKFEIPDKVEKDLESTTSIVYLQIISVAFEHGKWKFSNGDTQFFADIKDKDFLTAVTKNEQQFGSTDTLKVELQTSQKLNKDGILKSYFTILKVLDHLKGAQQIELDFDDTDIDK